MKLFFSEEGIRKVSGVCGESPRADFVVSYFLVSYCLSTLSFSSRKLISDFLTLTFFNRGSKQVVKGAALKEAD